MYMDSSRELCKGEVLTQRDRDAQITCREMEETPVHRSPSNSGGDVRVGGGGWGCVGAECG